jgi:crotonobetainyl-CoA hydratase
MPSIGAAEMVETVPDVLVERVGQVSLITINRPDARNAINQAVCLGVGEALEAAERDPEIRAIVITGAGDKAFCAGGEPEGP